MEKMTLARALRYKKRVVETIRTLETDIQSYNSVLDGTEPEVDVRKALAARAIWVQHLTDLKLRLQEATRPIQRSIFELAEAKAEITLLQRLNTNHGKVPNQWGEEKPQTYFAVVRKAEKDQAIVDLQTQIDQLQTSIDAFNAATTIEVVAPDLG